MNEPARDSYEVPTTRTEGLITPPFLVWALVGTCPVRGFEDGSEPARVERQLRAARAVDEARQQGRVFGDLVVRGHEGFRISEAMAVYGGLASVDSACKSCSINVLWQNPRGRIAGCYGEFPFPSPNHPWHTVLEATAQTLADGHSPEAWRRTRPLWYGLWCGSPLDGSASRRTAELLAAVPCWDQDGVGDVQAVENQKNNVQNTEINICLAIGWDQKRLAAAYELLVAALKLASAQGIPLHVQLFPPGKIEGPWWLLPAHCPRCQVPWPRDAFPKAGRSPSCPICGYQGSPASARRRHVRGGRPYRPLVRLLSPSAWAKAVSTYPDLSRVASYPAGLPLLASNGPPA